MRFRFTVDVEVERTQGKFAAREEIAAKLLEAIEDANPNDISTDADAEYSVSSWETTEEEVK
jgi:hypothetical protein